MLLSSGDHIVAGMDIYGGTYRLLHKICNRSGIDVTLVDLQDPQQLAAAISPRTKMVWLESIGNPRLTVPDLPKLSRSPNRTTYWSGSIILSQRQSLCVHWN